MEDLLHDLASDKTELYLGAENVLAVAGGLRSRGFSVEIIPRDPGRKPTPDFKANLAGRWIAFEAAALQPSQSRQDSESVSARLNHWARQAGISSTWFVRLDLRIKATEALNQLDDLKKEIQQALTHGAGTVVPTGVGTIRVFRGPGPVSIMVNGLITDEFTGVADQRELRRILQKVQEKYLQVKDFEGPSVVVVRNNQMLVPAHRGNLEAALHEMAMCILRLQALPALPRLSAVLNYEEWVSSCPAPKDIHGDFYLASVANDPHGCCRASLVVTNPSAQVPLTPEETMSLVGPESKW